MKLPPRTARLLHAFALLASMFFVTQASAQTTPAQVYGVNAGNEIFQRMTSSGAWQKIGGLLKQVSVAADGTLWGVNKDDSIFRWTGKDWATIGGKLRQISCGAYDEVWGTNAGNQVFRFAENKGWTNIPGALKQVEVGADGSVFGIDLQGRFVEYIDAAWTVRNGVLAQVSVADKTHIWGVDPNSVPQKWTGSGWTVMPGRLTWIGGTADNELWGVNSTVAGDKNIYKFDGTNWVGIDGRLVQIAAASGVPTYTPSMGKLCWKTSYGRGVGTVPTDCPAGQEKQAGLCYKNCNTNYVGVGPVCWGQCPSGFRNDPAHCGKPGPYGVGGGYPWQFGDPAFNLDPARQRCANDNRETGCEQDGAIIYPKCKPSYHKVGCCTCSPDCPSGFTDIGVSCEKPSYGRSVGVVPSCGGQTSNDTGLCYPSCARDFDGVGPVCWGKCPKEYPFACGAGCAQSELACGAATSEMVLSTVSMAVNLLSIPFGGPGLMAAGKAAMQAGRTAATAAVARGVLAKSTQAMMKPLAKAFSRDFAKTFVKTYLKNQYKSTRNLASNMFAVSKGLSLTAANKAANEFGTLKTEGQFDYSLLTIADPTGISSMVYAFAQYGNCEIDELVASKPSVDFGTLDPSLPASTQTLEITVQKETTFLDITTNAFAAGCGITATSDCAGRTMQVGQKCSVKLNATAGKKINGEVRLYTHTYNAIPFAIPVTANASAATECADSADADEAINLSSLAGAWAWNNDQATKFVVNGDGSVTSWLGNGSAKITDPLKRTFELSFGNVKATGTLTIEHERMDIRTGGAQVGATKRPWDSRCEPGFTFFAGLCYDLPIDYEVTSPGFIGKVCPDDWRSDGTSCYPPWSGAVVSLQADPEGTEAMRHPILVTDCANYNQTNKQVCPVNFKNTAVCTCEAQPTSKGVKSLIGKMPK